MQIIKGLTPLAVIKLLVFLPLVIILTACGLYEIKQQSDEVQDRGEIHGSVLAPADSGPIIAVLLRRHGELYEAITTRTLSRDSQFVFYVLPGDYIVGAYVDANGDGVYQTRESAAYFGRQANTPDQFTIDKNSRIELAPLRINGPINNPTDLQITRAFSKPEANIGKMTTFDDPMFSRDSANMGMWRPLDFLEQYGGGLMLLQEYQPEKTPVLFVHGIVGTAADFENLIAGLDRETFQPWVLQYPSGVRLQMVSDYLIAALERLHARHGFSEIIVIAHSMGGLVTRSFVKTYTTSQHPYRLGMVMTINSPLYGMDSAASGVKHSPIVVPAWRDVATDSDFIKDLHEWHWPSEIPYQLVFSYLPGEGSDGVVKNNSQLSYSLQREAVGVMGFEAQHAEVLRNEDFIRYFNEVMTKYSR